MLISGTVVRAEIPEGVYTMRLGHGGVLSGGGFSSNTAHNPSRPWRGQASTGINKLTWTVGAEEIGEARFRITLRARRSGQE